MEPDPTPADAPNPKLVGFVAQWLPTVGKVLLGLLWTGVLWLGNTAWGLYQRVGVLEDANAALVKEREAARPIEAAAKTELDRRFKEIEDKLVALKDTDANLLTATKVIEGKLPFFLRATRREFDNTHAALFGEAPAGAPAPVPVLSAAPAPAPLPVRDILVDPLPAAPVESAPPAP